MSVMLVLVAWMVAVVFAWAGWSKLGTHDATAATMVGFGVPARYAPPLARLLPIVELLLAVMMLLPLTGLWGAVGSGLLLLGFAAVMSLHLARGHRPSCNCVGQARPAPIAWSHVLRNALLGGGALAYAAVNADGGSAGLVTVTAAALGSGQAVPLVLTGFGLVLAFLVWLVAHLARQQGRLLLKIDVLEHRLQALGVPAVSTEFPLASGRKLYVGEPAPRFAAVTLSGRTRELADLLRESGTTLLVFVGLDCSPCHELMRELPSWNRADGKPVYWATVSAGDPAGHRASFKTLASERVLIQNRNEINELYGVLATPSALWIRGDGSIASPLAVGRDAIKTLFDAAVFDAERDPVGATLTAA